MFQKVKFKSVLLVYIMWIFLFALLPVLLMVRFTFTDFSGRVTVSNFFAACQFSNVLLRSLVYGLITSVICLILGYPMAFFLAKLNIKNNFLSTIILTLPISLNFLLKTYAWMTFFEDNGILNSILSVLKLQPVHLMNTSVAVTIGLVSDFFPYMVLPIYNFLKKFDNSLIESAKDLGANSTQIFLRIILPLSFSSIVAGTITVFVPSVSTFLISKMLGGVNDVLIGDLIEMQFLGNFYNPHLGSAISLILMIITMLCTGILNKINDRTKKNIEKCD